MTVLNKYHFGNRVPPGAIDIMRGTDFGNPYRVGPDGDRIEVVTKFRGYLWRRLKSDPEFRRKVADLHGRDLCCCCAPAKCHGDLLEKAAAWLSANPTAFDQEGSRPEPGDMENAT